MRITTAEKTKIIEKVRKLLALSESPNEHEAALAAARARDLLDKYDMALSEIDIAQDEILQHQVQTGTRRPYAWMGSLAVMVGYAFSCRVFRSGGVMVFCGTETDTQVADYIYIYLIRTVRGMYDGHKRKLQATGEWAVWQTRGPRIYLNSYATGLVRTIEDKLKKFVESQERRERYKTHTGKDLMVLKDGAVQAYFNKIRLRKGYNRPRFSGEGYARGLKDGESISINRGVNQGNGVRAIKK